MYRKNAIIVGVLFIIATIAALVGSSLIHPILAAPDYLREIARNGNTVIVSVLFSFLAAVTSCGIAIALYPVLKKYHEGLAIGSVGFRLIESTFYIIGALSYVLLFALGKESVQSVGQNQTFQLLGHLLITLHDLAGFVFGAITFSVGGFLYYLIFYQFKLIPRWLSVWGLISVVLLFLGCVLVLFGGGPYAISGKLALLAAPIGLQEIVLAIWLIVKGYSLKR